MKDNYDVFIEYWALEEAHVSVLVLHIQTLWIMSKTYLMVIVEMLYMK